MHLFLTAFDNPELMSNTFIWFLLSYIPFSSAYFIKITEVYMCRNVCFLFRRGGWRDMIPESQRIKHQIPNPKEYKSNSHGYWEKYDPRISKFEILNPKSHRISNPKEYKSQNPSPREYIISKYQWMKWSNHKSQRNRMPKIPPPLSSLICACIVKEI